MFVASQIHPRPSTPGDSRLACAGFHHVLQAEHLQVHPAALGPDARLLHRLRHRHAEDVQVRAAVHF